MNTPERKQPVCPDCGSTEVRLDAYAAWNTESQDWELSATFDSCTCEDCGEEARHGPEWKVINLPA